MAFSAQHSLSQLLDAAGWQTRSWKEIKATGWLEKLNYTNVILLVAFIYMSIRQTRAKYKQAEKAAADSRYLPAPDFPDVESLPEFSWKEAEPLKLRTFKPKYHLTMALQKLDPSELILMDKNYADRLAYRTNIMKHNHELTVGVNDDGRAGPAVRELYTYLLGTYLPKRYPTMFKLYNAQFDTGNRFMLENLVTKELHPARPSAATKTTTLLQILGRNLDEEFLFLLPETDVKDGQEPKYVLEAYEVVTPSGFDMREKLGTRLADIHKPVPSYQKTIEGSMDRYFARLKAGEYVKRSNWNITTNTELFSPGSGTNHAHEGDKIEQLESIDVDKTFLRCERQTLHRLPQSKAVVFAFKTHLYPIRDLKEEGLGEDLAQAIDGLGAGNAPAMHFYKRGVVWGEAVKRYLRA